MGSMIHVAVALAVGLGFAGCIEEPPMAESEPPRAESTRIGADAKHTYRVPLPEDTLSLGPGGYKIQFTGPGWHAMAFRTVEPTQLRLDLEFPPTGEHQGGDHAAAYLYPDVLVAPRFRSAWIEWWGVPHWSEQGWKQGLPSSARVEAMDVPRNGAAILVVATSLAEVTVHVRNGSEEPSLLVRQLSDHVDHRWANPEPERQEAVLAVPPATNFQWEVREATATPSVVWFASWRESRSAEHASSHRYSLEYRFTSRAGSGGGSSSGGAQIWEGVTGDPLPSEPKFRVTVMGPDLFASVTRSERFEGLAPSDPGGVAWAIIPYLRGEKVYLE